MIIPTLYVDIGYTQNRLTTHQIIVYQGFPRNFQTSMSSILYNFPHVDISILLGMGINSDTTANSAR